MRGRAEGGDSEDALWALAATPAIVADYARLRSGAEPLAPDPELGIVENYLLKLSGELPGRRRRPARSTRTSSSAPSTA